MPIRLGGRGVARVPEEEPIIYREMEQGEEEAVCTLVARVFDEFVAPEYEQEGRVEFFRFANPDAMEGRRRSGGFVLVARQAGELVGMLEFILPDHISLLFVSLRQRGVARELMARAVERAKLAVPTLSQLTVNSSSYAEVVYRRMGFLRSGETRTEHGIRYIPMTLFLEGTDTQLPIRRSGEERSRL
jgi:GNAT superfamily N-acetyltransferase